MKRSLLSIEELDAGPRWASRVYRPLSTGYRDWFLREGDAERPSYMASIRALRQYMPELVPVYDRLVDLAGGGDQAARLLSLWCPPPYLTGCSQAVWSDGAPLLVRNYDYVPRLWDGVLLSSAWTGKRVIAMLDCLWGVLDGINGDGLCVSLSFGGRQVVGVGFGMPLILRYILETCRTVDEGVAVLHRVPSHMSYNITLLDARGEYRTLFVAPDRPTVITHRALATNHQRVVEWAAYADATSTLDRERFLRARLEDPEETAHRFVKRFLEPPLYHPLGHYEWGTLYTSVYQPTSRSLTLHWQGTSARQTIDNFQEMVVDLSFTDHLFRPRRT